jgi:hypothetical protein
MQVINYVAPKNGQKNLPVVHETHPGELRMRQDALPAGHAMPLAVQPAQLATLQAALPQQAPELLVVHTEEVSNGQKGTAGNDLLQIVVSESIAGHKHNNAESGVRPIAHRIKHNDEPEENIVGKNSAHSDSTLQDIRDARISEARVSGIPKGLLTIED